MNQELNDKLFGLQYDPRELLSVQGDELTSFVPHAGRTDNQKYIVVHKKTSIWPPKTRS